MHWLMLLSWLVLLYVIYTWRYATNWMVNQSFPFSHREISSFTKYHRLAGITHSISYFRKMRARRPWHCIHKKIQRQTASSTIRCYAAKVIQLFRTTACRTYLYPQTQHSTTTRLLKNLPDIRRMRSSYRIPMFRLAVSTFSIKRFVPGSRLGWIWQNSPRLLLVVAGSSSTVLLGSFFDSTNTSISFDADEDSNTSRLRSSNIPDSQLNRIAVWRKRPVLTLQMHWGWCHF